MVSILCAGVWFLTSSLQVSSGSFLWWLRKGEALGMQIWVRVCGCVLVASTPAFLLFLVVLLTSKLIYLWFLCRFSNSWKDFPMKREPAWRWLLALSLAWVSWRVCFFTLAIWMVIFVSSPPLLLYAIWCYLCDKMYQYTLHFVYLLQINS